MARASKTDKVVNSATTAADAALAAGRERPTPLVEPETVIVPRKTEMEIVVVTRAKGQGAEAPTPSEE